MTRDIIALARQYGRYGYRRITALLRDAGWLVNKKRVERIWRQEGLKVPQRQPKRGRLWLNDGWRRLYHPAAFITWLSTAGARGFDVAGSVSRLNGALPAPSKPAQMPCN